MVPQIDIGKKDQKRQKEKGRKSKPYQPQLPRIFGRQARLFDGRHHEQPADAVNQKFLLLLQSIAKTSPATLVPPFPVAVPIKQGEAFELQVLL